MYLCGEREVLRPLVMTNGLRMLLKSQPRFPWPLQEPNLEVPTIYKAYGSGDLLPKYGKKIYIYVYIVSTSILGSWIIPKLLKPYIKKDHH